MSFPKYSKYKDSGVKWLGEVPDHWDTFKLRRILLEHRQGYYTTDSYVDSGVKLLRITDLRNFGNVDFSECPRVENRQELEPFLLKELDFVFARTGGAGTFALIAELTEPIAYASYLIRFRFTDVALPKFLRHYFLSANFQNAVRQNIHGGVNQNVHAEDIKDQYIALPSLSKQTLITSFLDCETSKIDALVEEQRRLIELLKEKRQAVISHAVTKGLNPNAPLKPSGIEWLGDVPEHWRVMSLGRVTLDRCDGPFGSGLKSEHYTDAGVRVIRLQNIRSDGFNGDDEAFIDPDYYTNELNGHDVQGGDVLIAGLGDDNNPVGRSCVAPVGIEPAMVKADCFRFRLDVSQVSPEFVATQLSAGAPADAGVLSSGSTRSRIPLSVTSTRRLALPPIKEQLEIANFIRTQRSQLDALTAEAERGIELLQERRTALISAAVTGKIDVRGIACEDGTNENG